MLEWIMRWIRPSALSGLTTGLAYVGDVHSDHRTSRVYSNIKVVSRDVDNIVFEGDARVNEHGHVRSGRGHGKIVSLFHDESGKQNFFSIEY